MNCLYGAGFVGATIVCCWLRLPYCIVSVIAAELMPPSKVETDPLTGSDRPIMSLRMVLSLFPVQTSKLAL